MKTEEEEKGGVKETGLNKDFLNGYQPMILLHHVFIILSMSAIDIDVMLLYSITEK